MTSADFLVFECRLLTFVLNSAMLLKRGGDILQLVVKSPEQDEVGLGDDVLKKLTKNFDQF